MPSPVGNFSFSPIRCLGQPVQFSDLSQTNGGGTIQNWNWNFGDPLSGTNNTSTLQNPLHSFSDTGTYYLTLVITSTSGCSHTRHDSIHINPLPVANFSSDTACEGGITQFTDMSIPNGGTIISYSWTFGDGGSSPSQSPQHTYLTYGTYLVTLMVTNSNGCIHSVSKTVFVNPKPVAEFSYSPSSCVGTAVSFTNQSFVPAGFSSSINKWEWNFGDGSIPVIVNFPANPNVTHTFQGTATSHIVRLTVTTTKGCISYIEKTVNSVPAPISNFSFSSVLCSNQPVQFTDLSQTNGGGSIQSWAWNFGDPPSGGNNTATIQNPIHQFTTNLTYNVTLVVTNGNGCINTVVKTVQVNARPIANFSADTVCLGSVSTFTDISSSTSGTITSRYWEFGDGTYSTTANPTHLYATSGNFNVKLTVTNSSGCQRDTIKPILVLGTPVSSFSYSSPNCAGDSIQFNDLSSTPHGTIQQWIWDFGDGTPLVTIDFPANQNVKHKFANGGNYNVKLTIKTTDNCEAQKITLVQVGFKPLANFSFGSSGCALIPFQFNDLSQTNGGPSITQWLWDFDDLASGTNNTSTTQNPTHAFTAGGTFTVRLTITNANGCTSKDSADVTINDAPVAIFSNDTACLGSETLFTDESTTGSGTIITWNWNFGDPGSGSNNTSTLQNPTHVFSIQGVFNVTLSVTNSHQCVKDTSIQITVNPKPIAMFEYSAACVLSETQFTDMSTAPGSSIETWLWDFGDGTPTSNEKNPVHIFTTAGTFQVKLTVKNLDNCYDSVIMPVISRPTPIGNYTYTSYFCPQGKVDFQDLSTATGSSIFERLWIFEPGYTSNIQNPSHTFGVTDTTYAVTLIVTDIFGCKDTIIDSVYVKPGFSFTFSNDTVCFGSPTHFNPINKAAGDTLYSVLWNFGDPGANNTSTLYRPSHTFSHPGVFIVKMRAYNSDNCVDSVFREVKVNAPPQPLFSYISTPCDSTVHFTDSTQIIGDGPIASWEWIWGDGTSTTINSPGPGDTSHLYVNAGIYPVTLVMTTVHGCTDSITKSVQRYPCIKAGFTYSDTLCARYKVAFYDNSLPTTRINQWKWIWDDGTDTTYTTHGSPVYHTFADTGSYHVSLEIQALVNGTTIIDNLISTVKVLPTPITHFSNVPVCLNQITLFRDTSKTFGENVTRWHWSFSGLPSDTSALMNPQHLYDTAGIYNVKLIVNNRFGCKDSLTKPTRVYGLPVAHYTNTLACTGDPTFFTDNSIKSDTNLRSWRWFFGDPTTNRDTSNLMNPHYRYPTTGDFSVRMIVKDYYGCRDTVDSTVRVNVTPLASFTLVNEFNGKQGQVKLNNFSTGAESYFWDFGNGKNSTEENPVATFTEDDTYTIKLVSENEFGCSDTTMYEYKLLFKGLYVPNAFAPTSTNLGVRLFQPVGTNLKQYHVAVFDIWGHMVWESTKLDDKGVPTEGWDGTFEGQLMPQGNYMWKITALFVDDSPWNGSELGVSGTGKTMGSVSLIR